MDAIEKAGYTGKVAFIWSLTLSTSLDYLILLFPVAFNLLLMIHEAHNNDADQNRNGCCSFRVSH